MGQIIEVPGKGPVEFPDGMSDEQIVSAIKANTMFPTEKPSIAGFMAENRARNAELFKNGWGSGMPEAVYNLGGWITDKTGSPVAGGIANFLANAVPTFLTGGRVAGTPSSLAAPPAEWLMKKAVKPNQAARRSGAGAEAGKTMLEEAIYPTEAGMEKADKIASKMEKLVNAPIEKSTANVKISDITAPVADVMRRAEMQFVPQADVRAVEDVWTKAMQNPLLAGKTEIPVQLAHQLKKGTYESLGGKAYGEMGSKDIEAQKALARGARLAVMQAAPETKEPLARQAAMMNVMDVAGDRALLEANKNLFGLMPASSHPLAAVGFWADRWAALKAFLALQLYHGAKPQALTPLSIAAPQAPALRQDFGALYSNE